MSSASKPISEGEIHFTFASDPRVEAVKKQLRDKNQRIEWMWAEKIRRRPPTPCPTSTNKHRYEVSKKPDAKK